MESKLKKLSIVEVVFIIYTIFNIICAFGGEDVVESDLIKKCSSFVISIILLIILSIKDTKEKNKSILIFIMVVHEFLILALSVLIKCFCINITYENISFMNKILDLIKGSVTFLGIIGYFIALLIIYFKRIKKVVESDDFEKKHILKYIKKFIILTVVIGFSREFLKLITGLHH